MAFQLPTVAPNLTVQPPQVQNPVQQATALASLKNMQSEQALRQQLAPLDVQEAQGRVQQQQMVNQEEQLKLQTMQAQNKYWSQPDSFQVDPSQQPQNDKVATMLGVAADDPILAMVHGQMKAGVPGMAAINDAKATLDFRKSLLQTTEEHQKVLDDAITHLQQLAAPTMAETDPTKKAALIENIKPQLAELAKGDPSVAQMIPQLNLQNFDAFVNRIGAEQSAVDYRTKSAAAWKSELENAQTADPLLKMQMNPSEAFSGDKLPASIAFLSSKVNDPDAKTATLARQLLGQANTAKGVELSIDTAKKQAAQAIQDGDPNAAAKLLVDGTVAPSQLISSRKPEFAQKAFSAAAALQPGWSATKADADYKVASSPAQVAFFGSAKSLTDPGGTLDQLAAAAKDIPGNQIPVFNTVADAIRASTGSGPIAKYASLALGVADDYSKVMGGGQGSDTSRTQALNLIAAKQSPEQRVASIEGIRGAVNSQKNSRIGANPVLQKMYGEQSNANASKVLTTAQVAQAAKDHNVSVEEATRQAKAAGYTIQ